MKDTKAKQWKEVDERFDKEFTCIVTYEKWPDEEEQRLREPQYKFKDFPNTNPKMVKSFLHQELSRVREEGYKEGIEKAVFEMRGLMKVSRTNWKAMDELMDYLINLNSLPNLK